MGFQDRKQRRRNIFKLCKGCCLTKICGFNYAEGYATKDEYFRITLRPGLRCGSRIWSRGGPGAEAESCRCSEVESRERSEQFAAGVQGPLKGPGSFWVFNAQICILPHSRDSFSLIFDIYFNTKS